MSDKKNLIIRIVAGIVLIPIALYLSRLSGWYFLASIIILSTLGVIESSRILKKLSLEPQMIVIVVINLTIQILIFLNLWLWVCILLFAFLAYLFAVEVLKGNPQGSITRIGANLLALSIGLLFSFLTLLEMSIPNIGDIPAGWRLVWTLLASVWSMDTFSYFGGKLFGKHLLVPKVSPSKTWEGFIVGAVFGVLGFMVVGVWLLGGVFPKMTFLWIRLLCIGLLIVLASLLGDLSESVLKRDAHIKDSGKIIMGHGGILDRLDSLLFAAPVMYFIFQVLL